MIYGKNVILKYILEEPEDEDKWNVLEGKYFSKLEMDLKTEAKNAVDEFCNVKGNVEVLLFLQDFFFFCIIILGNILSLFFLL